MPSIRLGTCSWKCDSWEGLVYSAAKGINFLEEYATKYDTVEIDQWFWSLHGPDRVTLPREDVVREYAAAVPADFRFTVKAPNSVTLSHFRPQRKGDPLVENPHFLSPELFDRFLDSLAPMRHLLGPVMLQFEYLNRQKIPDRSIFLDRLGEFLVRCPKDVAIGVESRNPNWIDRRWFALLEEHGVAHVYLQGYYMPPVWEIAARSGQEAKGAGRDGGGGHVTVIRLHGPDRKGMEERSGLRWDRIVEARDEDLKRIAGMAGGSLSQGVDVFLNVNNHFEGSAPLTIEKLVRMLDAQA